MERTVQAWDVVGGQFEALMTHLRDRLETANAEVAAERKALEKSLAGVASALEDALVTIGRTVRDPVVRDDVSRTVMSARQAVGTTFDEIGDQLRARMPGAESAKPVAPKPVATMQAPRKPEAAKRPAKRAAPRRRPTSKPTSAA